MMSAHPAYYSSDSPQIQSRNWRGAVDLPRVVELFNRCARLRDCDPATTLVELDSDLARPELDALQDVRLWEDRGSCIGFAALLLHRHRESIGASVWWRIAPDGPQATGALVAKWVAARAHELANDAGIPVDCHVTIGEAACNIAAAFRAEGFEPVRTFLEMMHRNHGGIAGVSIPQGYSVRSMAGMADWLAWVELRNAAFAGEWRDCPKTLAQAVQFRTSDPSYCPSGDLVAIGPDGAMAGLCQCVVRLTPCTGTLADGEGRVALLGVHPHHRRRGLGAALLQSGMSWLSQQGVQRISLGTDADSPSGACSLYQSAGFEVQFRRCAYERQFAPRAQFQV